MFGWITSYFRKKPIVHQPGDSECLQFVRGVCETNRVELNPEYITQKQVTLWTNEFMIAIYYSGSFPSRIILRDPHKVIYKLDEMTKNYLNTKYNLDYLRNKEEIDLENRIQKYKDKYLANAKE